MTPPVGLSNGNAVHIPEQFHTLPVRLVNGAGATGEGGAVAVLAGHYRIPVVSVPACSSVAISRSLVRTASGTADSVAWNGARPTPSFFASKTTVPPVN